jgi:hypothetical protein
VHLISDHINVGRDTGFSLLEMHKRLVDREWIVQRPGMARYVNHPISFTMLWKQESKLYLPELVMSVKADGWSSEELVSLLDHELDSPISAVERKRSDVWIPVFPMSSCWM